MRSVKYVDNYWHVLILYILQFYNYNDDCVIKTTVKSLKKLISDENILINSKLSIKFLSELYDPYIEISDLLESRKYPQVFYLLEHFRNFKNILKSFIDKKELNEWPIELKDT